MTVEILRIHEDYVTKTMFTLTEWFASLGATKIQNKYEKCQRKNWMFGWRFFTRLRGRKMACIAKSIRVAIKHLIRTTPHNKPFSNISDQEINY